MAHAKFHDPRSRGYGVMRANGQTEWHINHFSNIDWRPFFTVFTKLCVFYAYNPARIFWCMYVLVGKLFYANCLNRVIVLVIINHPLLPATLKTHWLKMTHCTLLSFVSSPMTPALLSRLQRPESYSRKHFSFFKTKTFLLKKGDFRLLVDLTRFWTTVEEISHCLWIIFFLAHPPH